MILYQKHFLWAILGAVLRIDLVDLINNTKQQALAITQLPKITKLDGRQVFINISKIV